MSSNQGTAETNHLIALCSIAEIPDFGGLQVLLDGREPVGVFKSGEDYYVTDDTCTHGEASLCEGEVDGDEIVCPYHMGRFDIKTGEPTLAPCSIPLRVYRVEIRDGTLYAEILNEA